MPTIDEIRRALSRVEEPELRRDIVSLNMVKNISLEGDTVSVLMELTTPACPLKDEIAKRVEKAVLSLGGIKSVKVDFEARVPTAKPVSQKVPLEGVKHVFAVTACKGGVGKSTVASNLAAGLSQRGARVGLLDADIYGPNIPLMMGVEGPPIVTPNNKIKPLMAHGVQVMSIGLMAQANTPMIWRGPMVHGAVQQLLRDTLWDNLDYLIVDLPPGTGDAPLTLIQSVPLAGVVVVTTPQLVSLSDGVKGINMFKKLNVPILGLIENMSGFTCPSCRHVTDIFSKGGGEEEARLHGIPFLGSIPIDPEVVHSGDSGKPVVLSHPGSSTAQAFFHVAEQVAARISVLQFEVATEEAVP